MTCLHANDNVSYARSKTHAVSLPPADLILRPLYQIYFGFPTDKTTGRRTESVNCLRILAYEEGVADEEVAAHTWGKKNKPSYIGYNHALIGEIHNLHIKMGTTNASFAVSIMPEHGNNAHCDLELNFLPGTQKAILNEMLQAISSLFQLNYCPCP